MQPDEIYEDLKMEEIIEEEWDAYEDEEELGMWSEHAVLEAEGEE